VTRGESCQLAESVHARLLNLAQASGRSFNDLLQLYAMERFLFRLAESSHSSLFILKGALLMRVWDQTLYRTTRDIDFLGLGRNDIASVEEIMRAICTQLVVPDGIQFDATSVTGESIIEDADYEGIRITLQCNLGNARIHMQIDVGFGDELTHPPCIHSFPTLLDIDAPQVTCYNPETVVAEKFQIMLLRGEANSRMKDFYDIWWIGRHCAFDGICLSKIIKNVCNKRKTAIQENPVALSDTFAGDPMKLLQWKAFVKRLISTDCPDDFESVVNEITKFLLPIASAIVQGETFEKSWKPEGPWV
jgi:hypothetical protein